MMGFVRKAATCIGLAAFALQICGIANAAASERQRYTQARHTKPRIAASPQRIVCGMTGCFDVPPGCRYEMRPNGYGVIAVVICDRR